MKAKRKTYAYLNQEFKFVADSAKEAGQKTSVNVCSVLQILNGKQTCTKQGWHFSDHRLTDEERYKLPVKDNHFENKKPSHWGKGCVREVESQVYEVDCNSPNVCYYPKKRNDKIEEFKTFLFTRFRERWLLVPKPLATLERQYIRDFLREMEK
jgi:hypothetical protein